MSNIARAIHHLCAAVRHAAYACERTRRMVAVALARLQALLLIQRVSA